MSSLSHTLAMETLWSLFTTDIIGAEWLVDEGADVELEQAAEKPFQGTTLGRALIVIFSADFNPATGELEKVVAVEAEGDVGLPASYR
jgi:hypothetical protein